jgi:hypothetical protein
MIMGRNGRYTAQIAHDHETGDAAGRDDGPAGGLTANAPISPDMARRARRKPASHFAP